MADSYIEILDANDAPKKVLTDLTGDVHTQQARLIAANEATLAAIQAAVEALQTAVEAFTTANRVQADVLGTVTANTGLTQPLTDTQLRATPVPISGTVTANTGLSQPLTDTQLRATAVPVNIGATDSAALAAIQVATEASQTVAEGVSREEITILNSNAVDAQQIQRVILVDNTGSGAANEIGTGPNNVTLPVTVNGDINIANLPGGATGPVSIQHLNLDTESFEFTPGTQANGLDVDVTRLPEIPAGTNLIGKVSAGSDTSTIYDGTTALPPKFAVISASSSGNNTIVAAVADKKIRVLSVTLSASGAVNAKFQSGASGTDITGLYYLAANGGAVLPHNPHGWFETAASTLLNLNLSAGVAVGGCITYIEI